MKHIQKELARSASLGHIITVFVVLLGLIGVTTYLSLHGLSHANDRITQIVGQPGHNGRPGHSKITIVRGENGARGMMGRNGAKGIGVDGAKGATGETGSRGAEGLMGLQGPRGFPGRTGARGVPGKQGLQGIAGVAPSLSEIVAAVCAHFHNPILVCR